MTGVRRKAKVSYVIRVNAIKEIIIVACKFSDQSKFFRGREQETKRYRSLY